MASNGATKAEEDRKVIVADSLSLYCTRCQAFRPDGSQPVHTGSKGSESRPSSRWYPQGHLLVAQQGLTNRLVID